MRVLSPALIGFVLWIHPSAQTLETCRPDVRWTEVEYRDVITGRYGVDREPLVVDCVKQPVAPVRSADRRRPLMKR